MININIPSKTATVTPMITTQKRSMDSTWAMMGYVNLGGVLVDTYFTNLN